MKTFTKSDYNTFSSYWAWRLRSIGDNTNVWVHINFDPIVIDTLNELDATIDPSIGIIFFNSSEDLMVFRLKV